MYSDLHWGYKRIRTETEVEFLKKEDFYFILLVKIGVFDIVTKVCTNIFIFVVFPLFPETASLFD